MSPGGPGHLLGRYASWKAVDVPCKNQPGTDQGSLRFSAADIDPQRLPAIARIPVCDSLFGDILEGQLLVLLRSAWSCPACAWELRHQLTARRRAEWCKTHQMHSPCFDKGSIAPAPPACEPANHMDEEWAKAGLHDDC
jgi:hypothetical protein